MKPFTLDPLPYSYNALEPYIDEATMHLHHDKHHQTYLDKLNATIATHPELPDKGIAELLKDLNAVPEDIRTAVKNMGGGFYNHNLFWLMLLRGTVMGEHTKEVLIANFGSVEKFQEEFSAKAVSFFGSGWVWLIKNEQGKLEIVSSTNQDTPISNTKVTIILGIDLWEHAYYLKYQNRRPEYVSNWWNVVNWDYVDTILV